MPSRFFYSFLGVFVGLTVPIDWLLWRAFSSRKAWWLAWLKGEMDHKLNIYVVLAIAAVAVFGLIGYLIGKREDDLVEVSKTTEDRNIELSQLASTDGLTGLFNTRYMQERLAIEIENSHRLPLSCLSIDLDHFKQINDQYGHPFGDFVLTNLARVLKQATRKADVVGRIGGEEFLVILPNTPLDRAQMVAERIRSYVEKEPFPLEGKTIPVTVSIGVVANSTEELKVKENLLQAVDQALYAAKRAGRNRVEVWGKLTV